MPLTRRFVQLSPADRVQLVEVAANPAFRNMLVMELQALNLQMQNLQPPSLAENAVQFLVDYRQIQQERDLIQDLLKGFSDIIDVYQKGE